MPAPIKIDVVSDIVCPWCAIGVNGLERAIERLGGDIDVELNFQPFELDPDMAQEGRNLRELFTTKLGMGPEQIAASRENIRNRGADVGFTFTFDDDRRMYNTFDAHRLLEWARAEGRQSELSHALFRAVHTEGLNISDREVLAAIAAEAGLDATAAREVLEAGSYADEVRRDERRWRDMGISSVPSFIINERYLISGGQPVDAFEKALRQIAAEP